MGSWNFRGEGKEVGSMKKLYRFVVVQKIFIEHVPGARCSIPVLGVQERVTGQPCPQGVHPPLGWGRAGSVQLDQEKY